MLAVDLPRLAAAVHSDHEARARRPQASLARLMQLLFSGAIPSSAGGPRGHRCPRHPRCRDRRDPSSVRVRDAAGASSAEPEDAVHRLLHDRRPDLCLLPHRDRSVRRLAAVEPAARITIPGFNDLHHCIPWDGGLAVANTGLETVDHVSLDGDLLHRWDLLDSHPEARRIDPDLDYRRIPDTKPHRLHPNHLWVRDGELWVTGLKVPGAVRVTGDRRQITFETGRPHDGPHDGRYIRGQLAFTTVRGFVVLVDPDSLEVVASSRSRSDDARHQDRWDGVGASARTHAIRTAFFVAFLDPPVLAMARVRFRIKHGHPEGAQPDRSLRRRARRDGRELPDHREPEPGPLSARRPSRASLALGRLAVGSAQRHRDLRPVRVPLLRGSGDPRGRGTPRRGRRGAANQAAGGGLGAEWPAGRPHHLLGASTPPTLPCRRWS